MAEEQLTVKQVREKVEQARAQILEIVQRLENETGLSVRGVDLWTNMMESKTIRVVLDVRFP